MDRLEMCECGHEAIRLFRPNPNNINKSKGIAYEANYNPGLGEVVYSDRHYKELCKIKGLEPLGNEKPETIHKHYDKQRQEKLDKAYDEADTGWVGAGD